MKRPGSPEEYPGAYELFGVVVGFAVIVFDFAFRIGSTNRFRSRSMYRGSVRSIYAIKACNIGSWASTNLSRSVVSADVLGKLDQCRGCSSFIYCAVHSLRRSINIKGRQAGLRYVSVRSFGSGHRRPSGLH